MTNRLPIHVELLQDVQIEVGLLGSNAGDDGTQTRLRAQARHGIDGAVHDIGTGLGGGNHGGNASTGSIMGMDVDGNLGELGSES